MKEATAGQGNLQKLNDLLGANGGTAQLFFDVVTEAGMVVRLRPNQFFRVSASNDLIEQIEKIDMNWKVELMMNEFPSEL